MKKAKLGLLSLLLLMIALSAAAGGPGIWTGWSGNGGAALDADSGAAAPPVAAPGRQFSEPATVLVLGAGLVFLGFYAKLKRAK